MGVQQETASREAATLRRRILATELGPCTVRVQEGTGGRHAVSGTADVYLHGAAGSWTPSGSFFTAAAAHDRVLIDLPGWGESTQDARMANLSIEAMARAVTGTLTSLGYRRWNLVGHSMGGFLALHIAAAWPGRTASVTAISATTFGVSEAAGKPLRSLFRFPVFLGMLLAMRAMAALGPAGSALVRAIGSTAVMRTADVPVFRRTRIHLRGGAPRARRGRPAGQLLRGCPGRGALRFWPVAGHSVSGAGDPRGQRCVHATV